MFAKLLKHEWRATAGIQAALCAAIVSLGALGMANVSALIRRADDLNDLAAASLGMSMVFIYLAVVICSVAGWILLMVRFYQSRFTDQGYLTFTLPVNVHQNFLSAFVNTLIWTLLTMLSVLVAFALMGVAIYNAVGADALAEIRQELDYILSGEIQELQDVFLPLLPGCLLQFAVSGLYSIVAAMTCLTVGATLAKKHKILAAFGIYYLISMATSMLQNALTVSLSDWYINGLDSPISDYSSVMGQMYGDYLLRTIPLQIVLIAACYILSTQMMKKKLNLN